MDLKKIEERAKRISLDTVDDLFEEWQRCEGETKVVTQILRCLRAALAFDARNEVRHYFGTVHSKTFLQHAKRILWTQGPKSGSERVLRRCLLQVLISASAGSKVFRKELLEEEVVVLDLAFSLFGSEDTKPRSVEGSFIKDKEESPLQGYIARLVKVCNNYEPQSFKVTLRLLWGLLDIFADYENPLDLGTMIEIPGASGAVWSVINNKTIEVLDYFDSLNRRQKCTLLDILHEWHTKAAFGTKNEISVDAVTVLTSLYKKQSSTLLTSYKNGHTEADPTITMKVYFFGYD